MEPLDSFAASDPPPAASPTSAVFDALGAALDRTGKALFKPFRLQTWLILGFLTFLQALGEGCGAPMHFPGNSGGGPPPNGEEIFRRVSENLPLVLFFGGAIFILALAVGILFQWLSARGLFCYLDAAATGRAEFPASWSRHAKEANSFFLLRLIFGLLIVLVIIIEFIPVAVIAITLAKSKAAFSLHELALSAGALLWLLFFVATIFLLVLIQSVFTDFVAPIQYTRGNSAFRALLEALSLIRRNLLGFLLFWLLKAAIAAVVGIIEFAGCFLLCCFTCCLGLLPVIRESIFQPLYLFRRHYSLEFLRRVGPEFDVYRD